MKIRIPILLMCLLVLAVNFGCAGSLNGISMDQEAAQEEVAAKPSTPPDWVLGRGHPRFTQTGYVVGVGFSDTNAVSANESARSNLAKELKVRIRSNMKDFSTTERTYIESLIETEVDTVLEGVTIKDGWYDQVKGVYYSLATLERKLASTTISSRIEKVESSLKRNMNGGVNAEKQGNVVESLSHYMSGYKDAPALSPLKSAHYIITRLTQSSEGQNITASDFESKIRGITHNLKFATVSGSEQTVKTQKGLAEPLVAKVFLQTGGEQIPAPNIPVVFNYEKGSGEFEEEKISNTNGIIQTTVYKISSFDEANHVVAVKLDFDRFIFNFDKELAGKLLSSLRNMKTTFNYSIQTPKWSTNKSHAWRKGITGLVNQVISNIPPGETPLLGVMDFKDLRYDKTTSFSRILKEDIKTILVRAEGLQIREISASENEKPEEIAKANNLDFYINGSYRMEQRGLEVRARLIETQTSNINSSANTQVARREINPEDLALLEPKGASTGFSKSNDSYQEKLERLVAIKPDQSSFNLKVWTDKESYQIGEKIVFSVESEKSGYLTLLDVNPNGNIDVIFPNKFHQDNFIRAGAIYSVPSKDNNFALDIQGPSGLERIKAIITLDAISLLEMDFGQGFHSVQGGTTRGMRDIKVLSKKILSADSSNWAEAYSEIFIFKKGETYTRGSRKIPIIEKPKKPTDIIGTFGNEQNRN
jgi:TolB-like protein